MMDKLPVEGYSNLYRDLNSGAIINSNVDDYHKYMESKAKRERLHNAVDEIDNLKSEMAEIKTLLKQLINQNAN
jgi:DNA-binding transcriptional regulator YhcF (GntR family)